MHGGPYQTDRHDVRGQSFLEFVLVLPILILLLLGLIEVALLMRAQLVLTNVTREAARLASRGIDDEQSAQRAILGFSSQLPAYTYPLETANTGIIITRFYLSVGADAPAITTTTYFSGTAPGTCVTRVLADYWHTLVQENEGFDTPNDVVIVEACHDYDPVFVPGARPIYDRTTMRISSQRAW